MLERDGISFDIIDEEFLMNSSLENGVLKDIPEGNYILDLGEVRFFAKVYINEKRESIATMPSYKCVLNNIKSGDELKIVVANTISNACANTSYFDNQDIKIVGTYHQNMVKHEKEAEAIPGLFGKVTLKRI